ncbi:MAG: xylose isomerase, partial [Chthoniobacterales bacterium]
DAKRRRDSFEPADLLHAHIVGMDTFAAGLRAAMALRKDGRIADFVSERYASWDTALGRKIEGRQATLTELHSLAIDAPSPVLKSGRQEVLEGVLNQIIRTNL